ncbi:MAG TPA: tRNA 4-thiouridine(8) synthase ThiI [Firmicutes bacterium]|nr:tRNA 4-thiouridine(8) synthase ThiI [Bacillota bacterium]
MKEIILGKCGEMALKGLNRTDFESILLKNLRHRLSSCGKFDVSISQSTIYIRPIDETADIDAAFDTALKAFGLSAVSRAAAFDKDMDAIFAGAPEYLEKYLNSARTFKVEAKRADKSFPLKSPEICRELGGKLLESFPHLKVDVNRPDIIVTVEIREREAYVRAGQHKGAGGLPTGTSGRATVLISGGIDSPVAAWMMARRGLKLSAVHFASPPYTSKRAEKKVMQLLETVAEYSGPITVYVVPFTKIQEEIRDKVDEPFSTLVMRRLMMRTASIIAKKEHALALVTGESLGQVASQTLRALSCTDDAASLTVFRPLIGMDKEEIITIARNIGTFETSIQPFEDCCTVFTPRHPKTRPQLDELVAQEQRLDIEALVAEAAENAEEHLVE